MSFVLVQNDDTTAFQAEVNHHLEDGYVFAGKVLYSDNGGGWTMPMIKFNDDKEPMDTRLAKQLWGMFIARLF